MRQKRVDFLALEGDDTLAIIEIKRPGDILPLNELRGLEDYKIALQPGTKKKIICVLIYGGFHEIPEDTWNSYIARDDFRILEWKDIFEKNKHYYDHYRSVLENHVSDPSFQLKKEEVRGTRAILEGAPIYRSAEARALGIGPQNTDITP